MSDKKKEEEVLEEVLEDLEKDAADQAEKKKDTKEDKEEPKKEEKAEKTEKKSGFKKKEKKDKKDEKIEELTDQVKRQMAEFDNFRKRTEKEKTQMFETGAKSVIEKILPVIDNFERGLAAVPEDEKTVLSLTEWIKYIVRCSQKLDAIGVKPIEAVGKEFDPEFHNAVMQVESEEYDSGIVAQELQKGYIYHDSVVRHSMVAVVQ